MTINPGAVSMQFYEIEAPLTMMGLEGQSLDWMLLRSWSKGWQFCRLDSQDEPVVTCNGSAPSC